MRKQSIAALAAFALSVAAPGLRAHDEDGSTRDKLGKVQFANSCSPQAQEMKQYLSAK